MDERVRPTCGVGWCRRESSTCDVAACIPGDPIEEVCNLLDDDCDGAVDENDPCDEALACIAGECRVPDEVPTGGSGDTGSVETGDESGLAETTAAGTDTESGPAASGGGGGCSMGGSMGWLGLGLLPWLRFRRRRR